MAINLSGIDRNKLVGRLLRSLLKELPAELTVRVLQGPTRGMKWIVGSGTHGCWLGSYEYSKRRQLESIVSPDQVVYDLGANVGYYTLLSSVLVGPRGRVVAFEPLPRNLTYLRRHIELNRLANCTVLPAAVGERPGQARFQEGANPSMGGLATAGGLVVEVVSLDDLTGRGVTPEPDVVKMDIEGGELDALKGAEALLCRRKPRLLLATHGLEIHYLCCDLLRKIGYVLTSIDHRPVDSTDELLATPGWDAADA